MTFTKNLHGGKCLIILSYNCRVEREVILKIKKLREGQNIAIYPFSRDFGDSFTAIGLPCPGHGLDIPLELKEPFKAIFLSYSGTVVMVRNRDHPCLLIDFEFIREIEIML